MTNKTRTTRGRRRAPPRRPAARPSSTRKAKSTANSDTCQTISARDLAALLGLDRKTVYEGARRGEIPSIRVGRRILFPRAAIETWLSAQGSSRGTLNPPSVSLPRKVAKQ